jgi:hypothetical protein
MARAAATAVKPLRSPAIANNFGALDDGGIRPAKLPNGRVGGPVIDDDLIIARGITSAWSPSRKK